MSEKGAERLRNILLMGVAVGFGFTLYAIVNKALNRGTNENA